MVKPIHTTIPYDVWKIAVLKEIKWSNALETGIRVLSGVGNSLEKIQERKQKLLQEIDVLDQMILDIETKPEKQEEENKKEVLMKW